MAERSSRNGFPDVVVTAVESSTSLATSAEDTWRLLVDGQSGIRALEKPFVEQFDSEVRIGGELHEEFDQFLTRVELRRLSYMQKMSTVLSRRLWDKAGAPEVDTKRLGVSIGLALAATEALVFSYDDFRVRSMRGVNPLAVQMHMPNAAAAAVGLDRKAKAGITTPMMADASGAAAVLQAWQQIVLGDADIVICGGVETKIEPVPIASWRNLGLLSTNNDDPQGACRPFDKNRDGMVVGEAGALMVLETEDHARARGADIVGRVLGGAVTYDGDDVVMPDPTGEMACEAITRAVARAGLSPADIDVVNAHATGTTDGDLAEARAIHRAFGNHVPAVYASKAALGHSLGSAGAVEAILTVQTLRDGVVPPTLITVVSLRV